MDVCSNYTAWVLKNPVLAGELEGLSKILALIVPSKLPNSTLFSELFYAFSNTFTLVNSQIILKAHLRSPDRFEDVKYRFQLFFTVVDYMSAFLEIGAEQLKGTRGKWVVITVIQLMKTVWRLLTLFKSKIGLSQTRPVNARAKKAKTFEGPDAFLTLRSGRRIRTIFPGTITLDSRNTSDVSSPTILQGKYAFAEILDALRPMIHLSSASYFGLNSWIPWLISLLIDSASLLTYSDIKGLQPSDRSELFRRRVSLLLYLFRSPLYNRFTKDQIFAFLLILSKTVPLARFVCLPLLQYIPIYQNLYFYTW